MLGRPPLGRLRQAQYLRNPTAGNIPNEPLTLPELPELPELRVSAGLVLGWFGLLAILSCGIVFSVSTVFPGYAALWPLGAVPVLLAGKRCLRVSTFLLLSSKPLAYLGDISYSLYLTVTYVRT